VGELDELQSGDPRRIGPYWLEGRLGSGGMGQVFLGMSAGGRPIAVKVIRAELAEDPEFRTRFRSEVEAARKAVEEAIPQQQAVTYDTQLLDEVRKSPNGTARLDPAAAKTEIERSRANVGKMINKMNELFQIVSHNMTPSTQLFTLTGPPVTRTLRSVSSQRLALYGLLVVLIALPAIIVVCLLHNRMREEEEADEYFRRERELAPTQTLP